MPLLSVWQMAPINKDKSLGFVVMVNARCNYENRSSPITPDNCITLSGAYVAASIAVEMFSVIEYRNFY